MPKDKKLIEDSAICCDTIGKIEYVRYHKKESTHTYIKFKQLDLKKIKRITVYEFFNSKEKLAIHCDTKAKAKKLLAEFEKRGYEWCDGKKYVDDDSYDEQKSKTCYTNDKMYGSLEQCIEENFIIFEFEDVDLTLWNA